MSEKRGETFVMKGEAAPSSKPIDFTAFLLGLASTALIHLGVEPNPETGAAQVNLTLARETLDLLALLREKTRGNLTGEEERLFASLVAELQLRFVEASKK